MWTRLPLPLRAVVTGLVVTLVPTLVWAALAVTNMRATPRVPWAAPVMAGLLWLYWRYLRGEGPPRRLAALRKERLRAGRLDAHVWRLALVAGGAGVAAVWAAFAALRGVLHIAAPAGDVTKFPIAIVVASILIGSAVAGVAEEAGFRGYMQLPMERAYGPAAAIAVTSILFTLAHLTHGRAVVPFLPFYFVVAVVYGLLAFTTGSILPAMILHFAGDVLMFALRYAALRSGVAQAASGTVALMPAFAAVAFAALSIVGFRLLARRGRIAPAALPALGS